MKRPIITLIAGALIASAAADTSNDGTFRIPRSGYWNVSEPSLQEATLGAPISTSMDYSTGRLTVSFELLRIEEDGITLPIVLSHTTGGLKVDSENGFAGAAWNLSLGGEIIRTVCGLPDEDYTVSVPSQSSATVAQLQNILEGSADSWHDRYSFTAGSESGAFQASSSNAVTKLVPSDTKITKTASSITISNPDGCVYVFEPGEQVTYTSPEFNEGIIRHTSYGPVTRKWRLAEIRNPQNTHTVTFTYQSLGDETITGTRRTKSMRASKTGPNAWVKESSEPSFSEGASTKYTNRSCLKKIEWRQGSLEFSSGYPCRSATLYDNQGQAVKEFQFTYVTAQLASRPRNLMKSWRTIIDSAEVDGADFEYYQEAAPMASKDVFGFCNATSASDSYYSSILSFQTVDGNTKLGLSPDRTPNPSLAMVNSLRYVTTLSGGKLSLEYEANTIAGGWLVGGITKDLQIGLRVKKQTLQDLASGWQQAKSFQYSGPVSTIDFSKVGVAAFINPGGSTSTTTVGTTPSTKHTAGATFLASSRLPGAPVENAEIHYAKVVETVTGTSISTSVVTGYEYNLENAKFTWVSGNNSFDYSDSRFLGIYTSNGVATTAFTNSAHLAAFVAMPLNGYFQERVGDLAPLVRKTGYRKNANGDTIPERVTTVTYMEISGSAKYTLGYHCESMVRTVRQGGSGAAVESFSSAGDFDHFEVKIAGTKSVPSLTATTEYAEDGTSRTIERTTKYCNALTPIRIEETVLVNNGHTLNYNLWKESIACGDQEATTTYSYSSDEASGILNAAALNGWTALPTKVEYEFGSAAAVRTLAYSNSNGGIRQTGETVACGSVTLDACAITRNSLGNPSAVTRNGGTPTYYTWSTDGTQLLSARIGSLTTSYTHKTLVGLASVTAPSSTIRAYTYSEGRLATEKIASALVRQYAYHLYGGDFMGNCVASTAVQGSAGITSYSYYDAFGNQIGSGSGPAATDSVLASFTQYDGLGRIAKSFRPVTTVTGVSSYSAMETEAEGQYGATAKAFSLLGYGNRADSRPRSTTIPGSAYAGSPATASYSFNLASASGESAWQACRRYAVDSSGSLKHDGNWPAGTLEIETSTDGSGHVVRRYTDFLGRTVCESRWLSSTSPLDTYYVYDDFGLLRFVLPPLASNALNSSGSSWTTANANIQNYAYYYLYNDKKQLQSKKAPGCGEVKLWYDKTGALCFTQDAVQRAGGKCSFSFADQHGRTCLEGECSATDALFTAAEAVQVKATFSAGASGSFPGYTLNITPTGVTTDRASFYDQFSFLSLSQFQGIQAAAQTATSGSHCLGLATGSLSRVLDSSSSAESWIASATSYDARDRATNTVASTIDGGYQQATLTYDNQDRVLTTTTKLYSQSGSLLQTALETNTYDSMGRMSKTTTKLNGTQRASSVRAYGPDGSLSTHALGSSLRIGYGYDTAGALASISKNGTAYATYTRGLNASISTMQWKGSDNFTRKYAYSYDGASRLTGATYTESGRLPAINYTTQYTYDANSNPLRIKRNGLSNVASSTTTVTTGVVDNLSLSYTAGKLTKVTDAATDPDYSGASDFKDGADLATEMTYDECGRLLADLNRGITSIAYNRLGLPERISVGASGIQQIYSADGTLLRRIVTTAIRSSAGGGTSLTDPSLGTQVSGVTRDTTTYFSPFIYKNGALDRTLVVGGYVKANVPYYYLRDHQGNIRQVVNGNTGAVVQESHYYPYGGLFGESSATALSSSNGVSLSPYKFGGKEQVDLLDCSYLDFSARMYDYQLGRFHTPGPLCESTPSVSSFVYCSADPINYADPTGLSTHVVQLEDGAYEVIGGVLDEYYDSDDFGIYLHIKDEHGAYSVESTLIGYTITPTSFYDTDQAKWAVGSIINPSDQSGIIFINEFLEENPSVIKFSFNALPNGYYDFKRSNGEKNREEGKVYNHYRGMPITDDYGPLTIYASARDIGNMVAGYEMGIHGLSWKKTRFGFDGLQSIEGSWHKRTLLWETEGVTSQNAQRVGYELGKLALRNKKKK